MFRMLCIRIVLPGFAVASGPRIWSHSLHTAR
jgi:hypothetical protein